MRYTNKILMALMLAIVGFQAQATVISLTPTDCSATGGGVSCITGTTTSTSVINAYIESMYSVEYLYKSDVGGSDSQSFAGSYDTTFSNTPTSPMDALIEYAGGQSISCLACYLLIKDGNHSPAWYLYDIGTWNGTDDISLTGFWPNGGAISHVAIYGDASRNVPAPGPLVLLTIGLVGLGVRQMKKTG